jgi:hypothetical protein
MYCNAYWDLEYCGCNGSMVQGLSCSDYAYGPTSGATCYPADVNDAATDTGDASAE